MLIAHILNEKGGDIYTVHDFDLMERVCHELHAKRVGALVVVDHAGAIAGVISERDIVREIARRGCGILTQPVATAMTRNVVTAAPSDTVDDALARMTDRRIRHLPVVVDGQLKGMVSIGDLVKIKISAVQAEAEALRSYICA
ncbi:MAG TPA: inosine-5-monophosphate dehydrogenase [Hyphomonadaceae bacterium]|nr:inosine-5-monophosphate dehydrogenase [Hyphomonadaceae bacterium]